MADRVWSVRYVQKCENALRRLKPLVTCGQAKRPYIDHCPSSICRLVQHHALKLGLEPAEPNESLETFAAIPQPTHVKATA
jgi:hypothetical protein